MERREKERRLFRGMQGGEAPLPKGSVAVRQRTLEPCGTRTENPVEFHSFGTRDRSFGMAEGARKDRTAGRTKGADAIDP